MEASLYIYDNENFKSLKNELKEYKFISMSYIRYLCKNDVSNIYELDISTPAIDITNFFIETHENRWHRGALEEYIYELKSEFDDLKFIISSKESEKFFEMYPILFDEKDIVNQFSKNGKEEVEIIKKEKRRTLDLEISEIYIYDDTNTIYDCAKIKNIVNFTQLVKNFNGMNISFDFDEIDENKEYYIEISSLIKNLKFRRDQIFYTELIFNDLAKLNNIKFLIQRNQVEELRKIFPFMFNETKEFFDSLTKNDLNEELKQTDTSFGEKVESIFKELNDKLQGHLDFKKDFKATLLKFFYLNKIGTRKILSIFICGKSGIGKTQFASLLSKIMYPNEGQIKLNFGNYSTEGVLNSLIGSPLGYVGSEKGGELNNKIKESESKVILIDEFEKADGKVFNFFYELLEDGQFTDRAGNIHDLNSYIIIFTSNLNKENYRKLIPEPLNSRFDMKYFFEPLSRIEKEKFIKKYSDELIINLRRKLDIHFDLNKNDKEDLLSLISKDNLREIKRSIEDKIIKLIPFKD